MNIKAMGHRIKYVRVKNCETQSDVAVALNVSRSTISKIENGKQEMSLTLLYSFSVKYNVSIDYLFGLSQKC